MTLRINIERKAFRPAGDAPERLVFKKLRLAFAASEVCAVVGDSGIGKSTLLAMMAGLDHDFAGTVGGRPQPIGFVFQTPRLLPWRTARENLALALPPDAAQTTQAWLGAIGLATMGEVYPERLSPGMARRVALARALAVEPRLLLLDEPFAGLDPATTDRMAGLIGWVAHEPPKKTTILVTHDLGEAAALADRILCLAGSPARVVSDCRVTLSSEDRRCPATREEWCAEICETLPGEQAP